MKTDEHDKYKRKSTRVYERYIEQMSVKADKGAVENDVWCVRVVRMRIVPAVAVDLQIERKNKLNDVAGKQDAGICLPNA